MWPAARTEDSEQRPSSKPSKWKGRWAQQTKMPSEAQEYDWNHRYVRARGRPLPYAEDIDHNWRIVKSIVNPDGGFNGGIDLVEHKVNRELAVRKRLLPRPDCVQHDFARWRREMLMLRKLDHHNIPEYIDGFYAPEQGSLYMQPCRLGSVSDFVDSRRKNRLSAEMQEFFLWYILHEVAEAVLYMQTGFKTLLEARKSKRNKVKGWVSLVHGDIRTDQIFLNNTECDPTPRVLLGDFGFAQFIKPWHRTETHDGPGGRSSSKAPEFPDEISNATDVFALGATAQLYLFPNGKPKAGLGRGQLSKVPDRPTIVEVLEKLEWGLAVQEKEGLGLKRLAGPLFKCLYPFPGTAFPQ